MAHIKGRIFPSASVFKRRDGLFHPPVVSPDRKIPVNGRRLFLTGCAIFLFLPRNLPAAFKASRPGNPMKLSGTFRTGTALPRNPEVSAHRTPGRKQTRHKRRLSLSVTPLQAPFPLYFYYFYSTIFCDKLQYFCENVTHLVASPEYGLSVRNTVSSRRCCLSWHSPLCCFPQS